MAMPHSILSQVEDEFQAKGKAYPIVDDEYNFLPIECMISM